MTTQSADAVRPSIDNLAREISDLLNASYAPDADRELVLWRRLTKVSEEAGEVQDALRGWVGENPRKGVTHTRSDVITELLDCAGAALGSVAHLLTEEEPAITDLLRERLEFVASRLRPEEKPPTTEPCACPLGQPTPSMTERGFKPWTNHAADCHSRLAVEYRGDPT